MLKTIAYVFLILLISLPANASNKTEMIEELIDLLRIQQSFEYESNLYDEFINEYMESVEKAEHRDVVDIDKLKNGMIKTLSDEFNWFNYKQDYCRIFSEVYSEDELKELISYYKSTIGEQDIEKELKIRKAFVQVSFERRKAVLNKFRKISDDIFSKPITSISKSNNNAALYLYMGNDFYNKKEYLLAISCYYKAIDLNQKDYNPYNNLAWLLATCPEVKLRNGAKAVELAEKAYSINQEAHVIDTLAAAYAEIGDYEKAITLLQDTIKRLKQSGVKDSEIKYYSDHLKELQGKAK